MSPAFLVMIGVDRARRIMFGSTKTPCAECGRLCWLSPEGQDTLAVENPPRPICETCFGIGALMAEQIPDRVELGLLRRPDEFAGLPTIDLPEP